MSQLSNRLLSLNLFDHIKANRRARITIYCLAVFMPIIICSSGCTSSQRVATETSNGTLTPVVVKDIDLSSGKVFYNLREDRVVPLSEVKDDTWDIAFDRVSIIANQEGQIIPLQFDFIKEAPESGYLSGSGSEGVELKDENVGEWYNYNTDTHVISALPDRSFIVRTPDGTYAKLQILSYYKQEEPDKSTPRFLTFRYAHQPDGTPQLSSTADSAILKEYDVPDVVAQ